MVILPASTLQLSEFLVGGSFTVRYYRCGREKDVGARVQRLKDSSGGAELRGRPVDTEEEP